MKKIVILIIYLVLLVPPLYAQYIYNEDDEPQPFCLNAPYRELIKPEQLTPAYVTRAYNNDSLLYANNPETAKGLAVGIVIDSTAYHFKEVATRYTLDHGNLWLYRMVSPTAQGLGIKLNYSEFPEGAQISFFSLNGSDPWQNPPISHINPSELEFNGFCYTHGNELYIEYYEPFGLNDSTKIEFKYIGYDFTNDISLSIENLYKKKDKTESIPMKSTGLGSDFYSTYDCCNKLPCLARYVNLSKPVVFIYMRTFPVNGKRMIHKGTGFFINRNPGYLYPDHPYILTAGHLFIDGNTNSSYELMELRVNYEDKECNDPKKRVGKIIGEAGILQVGTSYNKDSSNPVSGYCECEDYALLRSVKSVRNLAKSNIAYAGWSTTHDYLNPGYAYIGHPNGDVKTVNVETERAWVNPAGCKFTIYNKLGINEEGFSGSPVFYLGTDLVVGWMCNKNVTGSTIYCSDGTQSSNCGRFSDLHTSISSYIDPQNIGYAETVLPTSTALPAHCFNCTQDEDETGIDCGGSCQPCGMADDYIIASNTDLFGKSILNARFNITVNGSGSPVEFKSQEYHLSAGENISLKNFSVSNGATFYTSVTPSMMEVEMQGCQQACFQAQGGVFYADNIPIVIREAFTTSSQFVVKNNWQQTIYTSPTFTFPENGQWLITNLAGILSASNSYYVYHTYTDCNGIQNQVNSTLNIVGNKSLEIGSSNPSGETSGELSVFPNPFKNHITVVVGNNMDKKPYILELYGIDGKLLQSFDTSGLKNDLNLERYESGTYLLGCRSDDRFYTIKLIKK